MRVESNTLHFLKRRYNEDSRSVSMPLDRHPIRTQNANQPVASYSQGYQIGQFVFVSGQMPVDPATNQTVEGGSAEHTRQCLKNVFGVLEEAGCTYRDVGQAVVYMTNIDDIEDMDAVWKEFFPDPDNYCSRAVIGISKLVVGARIEISCIAIKD